MGRRPQRHRADGADDSCEAVAVERRAADVAMSREAHDHGRLRAAAARSRRGSCAGRHEGVMPVALRKMACGGGEIARGRLR